MRKIKVKSIYINKVYFYQKVIILTLLFSGIILLNTKNNLLKTDIIENFLEFNFGILTTDNILKNLENIKNNELIWPFKEVINRGKINDYENTKYIKWDEINDNLKINFPSTISDVIEKYKYISPYRVYEIIKNPIERQNLLFFKRLITTTWLASYECNNNDCKRWIEGSGNHEGVDIVTLIGTPIQSISNGLVYKIGFEKNGFGNYIIIISEYKGELISIIYGHLNEINVKEGELIKQGQIIGKSGNTGRSTAPHLHLQINKIGKIDELKNIKTLNDRIFIKGNLDTLRKFTYNPIKLIEESKLKIALIGKENMDIENVIVESIENPKISGILNVGDTLKLKILSKGSGNILISTENNLINTPNIIKANGINEINLHAIKPGNEIIYIKDSEKVEKIHLTIYPKDYKEIAFINIIGPERIVRGQNYNYKIITIDKLGNSATERLNGKIIIKINDANIIENNINSISYDFNVNLKNIGKTTIEAVYIDKQNKKYEVKKDIFVDIFYDYSINQKYGNEILFLNEKGIVKGDGGYLFPNRKINRSEFVTIIVRYLYGDKYDEWKKEYLNFTRKNGKIFKDLDINNWRGPYIYIARKNNIIKGENGNFYPFREINDGEIILILGRTFKISDYDPYYNMNFENKELIKYATAAKKYGLYDKDIKFITLSRLETFIILYKYINLNIPISKNDTIILTSGNEKNTNLEEAILKLLE